MRSDSTLLKSNREKARMVTIKNVQTKKVDVQLFDYVMVCNGHYNVPLYPKIKGIEQFRGRVLHSHNFRIVSEFCDHCVLVVGAGPSGLDLCNELSKVGKIVLLSCKSINVQEITLKSNVIMKLDIVRLDKNGAYFTDGSYEKISSIVLCTGYVYSFPFLNSDSGISVGENYVEPLWKHIINVDQPTMAFIGLPFYVCAAQMIDLQTRFVMQFFTGRKALPPFKEMLAETDIEMNQRASDGYSKRHAHRMGSRQADYYRELAMIADIKTINPVMAYLHNESSRRFVDDLINFRKDSYYIAGEQRFVQKN